MVPLYSGAPEALGKCDFEADLCGWKNVTALGPTKFYPWIKHNGSTPDESTGPSGDHTLKHGMYFRPLGGSNYPLIHVRV